LHKRISQIIRESLNPIFPYSSIFGGNIQFLEFDDKIHNSFLAKYSREIGELRNSTPIEQEIMLYDLYPKYARFVAERFPVKYKGLLSSEIEEDLPL